MKERKVTLVSRFYTTTSDESCLACDHFISKLLIGNLPKTMGKECCSQLNRRLRIERKHEFPKKLLRGRLRSSMQEAKNVFAITLAV